MKKGKILIVLGLIGVVAVSGGIGTSHTNNKRTNKVLLTQPQEGQWIQDGSQWYYKTGNSYIMSSWENINNNWYYFNSNGVMQTGWQLINGTWYYMNQSGAMQTGWVNDNGTWYYMNQSGAMQTGWENDNGTWYYMNQSGAMQIGWVNDGGTWYYMNQSGAMQTGITNVNGQDYYFNNSGAMQVGWIENNNLWYYAYSSGSLANKSWINDKGQWYYIGQNLYMITNGVVNDKGQYYALGADGAMLTNSGTVNGYKFNINSEGVIQTGWQQENGDWYFYNNKIVKLNSPESGVTIPFIPMGAMQTGWINENGNWYYLNENGVMQTGTIQINGINYTFASSGALEDSVQTISGKEKYTGLLNEANEKVNELNKEYNTQAGMSQSGMNIISYKQFEQYKNLYKEINNYLSSNLNDTSLKVYNIDSGTWENYESNKLKAQEKITQGGSITPLMINTLATNDYKARCEYLINTYLG